MTRAYTIRDRQTRFGLATDIRCIFQLFRFNSGICVRYFCSALSGSQIPPSHAQTQHQPLVSMYLRCISRIAHNSNHPLSLSLSTQATSILARNPVIFSVKSSSPSLHVSWTKVGYYPIRIHCHGRGVVFQDQISNVTLSGAFIVARWNKSSVDHSHKHRRLRFTTPLTSMSHTS